MNLPTEFEFMLPRGYVDEQGVLHRQGVMRLATALDEIEPLRDARVRANQAYLSIVLLARVITKLGSLPTITTERIEKLLVSDLSYLQTFYRQINEQGTATLTVVCPTCQQRNVINLADVGELLEG